MPVTARSFLALIITLAAGTTPLQAQNRDPLPEVARPARPWTQREIDRQESLRQYTFALVCVREDRLLEASKALEEAARLDPQAADVYRNLVRLYLAMDRNAEALRLGKKVVELDANDYESWYLYSRMLKSGGQAREACAAIKRGLSCPGVKEQPDLFQQMTYDLGVLHETLREYVLAAAALAEVASAIESPQNLTEAGPQGAQELKQRAAELFERAGKDYLQAKKYDEAIQTFREAQKRSPDGGGRLNFYLALVCKDQGHVQKALRYLDAYLQLQPAEVEPFELKIALQKQLGKENEIVPSLEQYVQRDAHNIRLKMLLARQYAQFRQSQRAEAIYTELTRQSPTPEVYHDLFELYQGNDPGMVKVLNLLNKTLGQSAAPDNGDEAKGVAAAQARGMIAALRNDKNLCVVLLRAAAPDNVAQLLRFDTLHLLAILADRHGTLDEAERFYRRCLPGVSRTSEMLIYGGLLRVLWKARKYENILEVCQSGLRQAQATNHVLFYSDAARALAQLDRLPDALAQADKAIRLANDEDRLPLKRLRVLLLIRAAQYPQAVAACQEMLKDAAQPADVVEVRHLLSSAYSSAKEFARSEEQLEQILKIDPNDATANNDLGYIWADQGKRLKEAEELIRKAIELDRRQRRLARGPEPDGDLDNAAYLDSLGWVLYRQGRFAEARMELEKATALPDGNDPVVWEHLGDIYARLGLAARARTTYLRAVQIFEQERRRTTDQRYRDLKEKIKLLERETQP